MLAALLDHLDTLHQPLVASMVAEAGQPVFFAEMAQFAAGMMLARNTIDLYLSLPHEEANPVPADELSGTSGDQSAPPRTRGRGRGNHSV